jgi:hypothetical protein
MSATRLWRMGSGWRSRPMTKKTIDRGEAMLPTITRAERNKSPTIDQEAIDFARFCLSDPDISEAEAIDNILIWRSALTPDEFPAMVQALPPRLQKRLYDLQEMHDQGQIPIGATVFGAAGTGALVVGREGVTLVIQSPEGRRGKIPIAKVRRWRYPMTGMEVTPDHDQN